MTATVKPGERTVSAEVDDYGYRTYNAELLVNTNSYADGPATVIAAVNTEIPVGSTWAYGQGIVEGTATFSEGEQDAWCWRRPGMRVEIHDEREGDRTKIWKVSITYSNKPLPKDKQRCQSTAVDNPLLEPAKVSGSFLNFVREFTYDRFGVMITNSAYELIRGSQVEFDDGDYTIDIEQNISSFADAVTLPYLMRHFVNDAVMWGFPPRCIKLSRASWEERFYGVCTKYYVRRLGFDIKSKGFDRDVLDEGTKALRGRFKVIGGPSVGTATGSGTGSGTAEGACPENPIVAWELINLCGVAPDPTNPLDFIQVKDTNNENIRVVLDGFGKPASRVGIRITDVLFEVHPDEPDPEEYVLIFTTETPHGLIIGDEVQVVGTNPSVYNGTYTVFDTTSDTVFVVEIGTTTLELEDLYVNGGVVAGPAGTPGNIHVEAYNEANLLLLGVPSSF